MLKEYLTGIADAIRSKLGITDKVNAQDFPDKVNEVYDKGRYDDWSEFWDVYQCNGDRRSYAYAFGTNSSSIIWNDKSFRPKYDIKANDLDRAFRNVRITDFKKILQEQNIVFDTSVMTNGGAMNLAFRFSSLLNMPEMNFSNITNTVSMLEVFCDCASLHTIDKIILPTHGRTTFTDTFTRCYNLKNITFEGVIGGSINFSWSPLTVDSMKSVISCLKNFVGTGNESTYALTFTSACWSNLEASTSPYEDGLTDDEGISWQEYINSIGWLVA